MFNPFVQLSLVLILAAGLGVLARFFKQPLILAYLLTGLVLGFLGANWVVSQETLALLSQFGIAFLLFMVGLELKLTDLRQVGKAALFTGIGQIVFTFTIGLFLTLALGFSFLASVYISIALTFSSTIIIVKLLSEKNDLNSLYGKIAVGFLLVQDFVAILILMFLSGLSQPTFQFFPFLATFFKGILFLIIVLVLTKRVIPLVFSFLAKSQEILFLTAVAWCFILSALSFLSGFSLEIGAFLAGVSLASLPYHYQISSRIRPLRDLFITLFFVSLGLQMVFVPSWVFLTPAVVLSLFILLGNPLIVLLIMGYLGFRKRTAFLASITVAQISEFSLILMALGQRLGHVGRQEVSLVTLVGIITIIASTYLILAGQKLYQRLSSFLSIFEKKEPHEKRPTGEKPPEDHVVLVGCNRTGGDILEFLKKGANPFLVLDFNPEIIRWLEAQNIPCLFGDVSDEEILHQLNFEKAKIIISTVPQIEDNLALISQAKLKNSPAVILVTASYPEEEEELYRAGADYVILPHLLGGKHLAHLLAEHADNLENYLYSKRKKIS